MRTTCQLFYTPSHRQPEGMVPLHPCYDLQESAKGCGLLQQERDSKQRQMGASCNVYGAAVGTRAGILVFPRCCTEQRRIIRGVWVARALQWSSSPTPNMAWCEEKRLISRVPQGALVPKVNPFNRTLTTLPFFPSPPHTLAVVAKRCFFLT